MARLSLSQGDVIFAQLACPWMIYNSLFPLVVINVVSKVRKKKYKELWQPGQKSWQRVMMTKWQIDIKSCWQNGKLKRFYWQNGVSIIMLAKMASWRNDRLTKKHICEMSKHRFFLNCTQEAERLALAKKLTLTCRTDREDQAPWSQHFIFFVTFEWPNKNECYIALG